MLQKSLYILLFYTTSCSIYSPQVTPPIIVENAGDIQFDIGVTTDLGVQSSLAVAATDHIAIQIAAQSNTKENYMLDASVGFSKNIGQNFRVGFFGGGSRGSGNIKRSFFFDNLEVKGSSKLYYLKPQLILNSNNVDFALSSKFGNIKQSFYYYEYNTQGGGDIFISEIEEYRKLNTFFIEPSFSTIFKMEKVSLVGSFSFIRNFGPKEQQGGTNPFNLGLSILFFSRTAKK